MSGNRPIIYWDSCVFLAWLKDEKRKAGQMAGVQSCVIEIESGKWELITSAIAFTEVLEAKIGSDINKKFQELFLRPNITAINADIRVAKLASELRGYYIKSGEVRSLTTPDAIHLATAILYDADEFHTFDDGKSNKKYWGLLELSGNVGGYRLIVVPPGTKQKRLDFDGSAGESTSDQDFLGESTAYATAAADLLTEDGTTAEVATQVTDVAATDAANATEGGTTEDATEETSVGDGNITDAATGDDKSGASPEI